MGVEDEVVVVKMVVLDVVIKLILIKTTYIVLIVGEICILVEICLDLVGRPNQSTTAYIAGSETWHTYFVNQISGRKRKFQ